MDKSPNQTALVDLQQEIQNIKSRLDTLATPDRYMNAREAANYIGISLRLFNERIKLGMWTSRRIGKRRVFKQSELDTDLNAFKEASRFRTQPS